MPTVYEYTPLHIDASTNIRLLEILQTDDETAPIACNLRVIALQDSPKYTALSYVWGPPTPAREIHVNDEPFAVRENLWSFLHQARRDRQSCAFWIDAICIDQVSDAERTHQVSMMGRIYSEAELVLAWLGTATKYSAQWERAMNSIPTFNDDDDHANFTRWYKVYGPSILDLFNSPYWSRLWIVQEYYLAHRVTIQCGCHNTTDESVFLLYGTWGEWLSSHGIKKRQCFLESMASSVILRRAVRFKRSTLEMLITCYCTGPYPLECTDRRDRVYALLALCDSHELPECHITPDYSLSILELYTRLVQRLISYKAYDESLKAALIVASLPLALKIENTEMDDLDHETKSIIKRYHKVMMTTEVSISEW